MSLLLLPWEPQLRFLSVTNLQLVSKRGRQWRLKVSTVILHVQVNFLQVAACLFSAAVAEIDQKHTNGKKRTLFNRTQQDKMCEFSRESSFLKLRFKKKKKSER